MQMEEDKFKQIWPIGAVISKNVGQFWKMDPSKSHELSRWIAQKSQYLCNHIIKIISNSGQPNKLTRSRTAHEATGGWREPSQNDLNVKPVKPYPMYYLYMIYTTYMLSSLARVNMFMSMHGIFANMIFDSTLAFFSISATRRSERATLSLGVFGDILGNPIKANQATWDVFLIPCK